ncbi:hypothetical protein EVAR_52953_1 [Eumeta japonica]|uniref:Uncharacterized protein n=1 Tax=Eumeta variegata TaxID=151549 RepID=A0A4C1XTF0_EUMVA|nr:hypothetical protein EVAR_52953_1 [Eumeta japonica]
MIITFQDIEKVPGSVSCADFNNSMRPRHLTNLTNDATRTPLNFVPALVPVPVLFDPGHALRLKPGPALKFDPDPGSLFCFLASF